MSWRCLFGHHWKTFAINGVRTNGLGHLSTRAGNIDLCLRCGEVWDDFDGHLSPYDPDAPAWKAERVALLKKEAAERGLTLRGDVDRLDRTIQATKPAPDTAEGERG